MNDRPAWLGNERKALAGAYGWEADFKTGKLTDEEILKNLFDLNQQRAALQ